MSFTITAAQRDAFYDQILDRLSGIGDIELAISAENYHEAQRLGREYSDDLRLLDALGFGEGSGDPVTLTTSPKVLLRTLPRLRDSADRLTASMEPQRAEVDELRERNSLISEACEALLPALDSESKGSRASA